MSKIREVLKKEQRLITEVPLYKKDGTLSYHVFIARCPSLFPAVKTDEASWVLD